MTQRGYDDLLRHRADITRGISPQLDATVREIALKEANPESILERLQSLRVSEEHRTNVDSEPIYRGIFSEDTSDPLILSSRRFFERLRDGKMRALAEAIPNEHLRGQVIEEEFRIGIVRAVSESRGRITADFGLSDSDSTVQQIFRVHGGDNAELRRMLGEYGGIVRTGSELSGRMRSLEEEVDRAVERRISELRGYGDSTSSAPSDFKKKVDLSFGHDRKKGDELLRQHGEIEKLQQEHSRRRKAFTGPLEEADRELEGRQRTDSMDRCFSELASITTGYAAPYFDVPHGGTGVNGLERTVPGIAAGVEGNAGRIIGCLKGHGLRSGLTGEQEVVVRAAVALLQGEERIVHRIYHDPKGEKTMDFLFGSGSEGPALLSLEQMRKRSMAPRGLLRGDHLAFGGGIDEVIGEEWVHLNREIGTFNSPSMGQEGRCMVVLSPAVEKVKGCVAFDCEDLDRLGKFAELYAGSVDGVDTSSRDYVLRHEPSRSDFERIARNAMLSPEELPDVRVEAGLLIAGISGRRRSMARSIDEVKRTGYRQDFEVARIEAEALGMNPGPMKYAHFFNYVYYRDNVRRPFGTSVGDKELLVPEAVGPAFIEQIVVLDSDYDSIRQRVADEFDGQYTIGGRKWDEVVVRRSEYEQKESGRIERFRRVVSLLGSIEENLSPPENLA